MPRVTAAMVAAGRSLGDPRLAPDATVVAFTSSSGGRTDLVLVPAAGGPERVLTSEPAVGAGGGRGGSYDWLPDSSALVYVGADGGLWCQPAAGGAPHLVVAPEPDTRLAAPAVSPDCTRVAFAVDDAHIDVAPLDERSTGLRARLSAGADFVFDPAWSPDSRHVAWHEWDVPNMPWDGSRIVVAIADGTGTPEVVAGGDDIAVAQPRFGPDGTLAYLSEEGDGWLQVRGAPAGADVTGEHGDPSWGQGIRTWCWSPAGDAIAVRTNVDGYGELVAGGRALGRAVHGALSWQGSTIAALRSGARTPPQIVAYDAATGERTILAHGSVAGWDELDLPEPEVLRTPGGVVARLYATEERAPLICWVHGGPTDQWPVVWRSRFPYFLDRGWSILVPDHRGSTGHGRAYRQALHGQWGVVDVADCAAATHHVVELGRADPGRLAVMGGSAGGLTTLLLLAHEPDLFAAGVALFPVTDLLGLAADTHRFERHYTHHLVGPLPGAEDLHRERSPLAAADRITAPVLLLHGSADPVVPLAQAEAFAARLDHAELHVYEGEGHGWGAPAIVVDELHRIEAFLDRTVLRKESTPA